jgi:sulfur-carrier protein adenylyltransferase/sulfurtransferase
MAKQLNDYTSSLSAQVEHVGVDDWAEWIRRPGGRTVIDVREPTEVGAGLIPGAIWISKGILETKIEDQVPDMEQEILIYCAAGVRSLISACSLKQMGYKKVFTLDGGINAWKTLGLKLEPYQALDVQTQTRYQKQILLPEIGEAGQQKLLKSRVLIVGAGGLGCPAALYLAAAGVGTIGLVDDDIVDLSNLQRQVLHNSFRIGMSKVSSAIETLKALNPSVNLIGFKERLSLENIDRIFSQFDLILDGSDNFQTRYLVNDACLKHRKMNVHGAIFGFTGQVSVFCADEGPCYRCLFSEAPPASLAPNCAENGVLGVVPGAVGLFEAGQVLNLILQIGRPLIGRLLTYNALDSTFLEFEIQKRPDCVCSHPEKIKYSELEDFCGTETI